MKVLNFLLVWEEDVLEKDRQADEKLKQKMSARELQISPEPPTEQTICGN